MRSLLVILLGVSLAQVSQNSEAVDVLSQAPSFFTETVTHYVRVHEKRLTGDSFVKSMSRLAMVTALLGELQETLETGAKFPDNFEHDNDVVANRTSPQRTYSNANSMRKYHYTNEYQHLQELIEDGWPSVYQLSRVLAPNSSLSSPPFPIGSFPSPIAIHPQLSDFRDLCQTLTPSRLVNQCTSNSLFLVDDVVAFVNHWHQAQFYLLDSRQRCLPSNLTLCLENLNATVDFVRATGEEVKRLHDADIEIPPLFSTPLENQKEAVDVGRKLTDAYCRGVLGLAAGLGRILRAKDGSGIDWGDEDDGDDDEDFPYLNTAVELGGYILMDRQEFDALMREQYRGVKEKCKEVQKAYYSISEPEKAVRLALEHFPYVLDFHQKLVTRLIEGVPPPSMSPFRNATAVAHEESLRNLESASSPWQSTPLRLGSTLSQADKAQWEKFEAEIYPLMVRAAETAAAAVELEYLYNGINTNWGYFQLPNPERVKAWLHPYPEDDVYGPLDGRMEPWDIRVVAAVTAGSLATLYACYTRM